MSQAKEPLHTISNTMIDINRVGMRNKNTTISKKNNSDGNNPPYSLSDQRSFNPYILDQHGNELYPHDASHMPNMGFGAGAQE